MTAVTQEFPKAFAVWFKDLERWDYGFFRKIGWQWIKEYICPLGKALIRKQIEVDERENKKNIPIIEKISFGGVVSVTEPEDRANYKGRLFWADQGDLIYSKIRVKQGSLAIVPSEMERLAVSAEYPVYSINAEIADPHYLALVLKSKPFMRLLEGLSHGGSTKTRIPPEEFERQEIPLPPIAIQQAIVDRWQTAQAEIKEINERLENQRKDILFNVQKALGYERRTDLSKPKAFALWWSEIKRWGVSMCWKETTQPKEAKYKTVKIIDVCEVGSGGTPSRRNPSYFGGNIPWVKTTEVRNEVIYQTEESITQTGLNNSSAKLYPIGSVLVAMYGQGATRGRTAKLGVEAATNQACAVLTKFVDGVDPDFVWVYLMSEYNELRELASGNNQPNLNAEMIANYPIPLPPLNIQQGIVKQVEVGRQAIDRERESADRKKQEIEAEIEALILGTKAIEVAEV